MTNSNINTILRRLPLTFKLELKGLLPRFMSVLKLCALNLTNPFFKNRVVPETINSPPTAVMSVRFWNDAKARSYSLKRIAPSFYYIAYIDEQRTNRI